MQTAQIITGITVAIGYSIAMLGWGLLFLSVFIGKQELLDRLKLGTCLWVWLGFVFGQGIWGSLWLILFLFGAISSWFICSVIVTGLIIIPILMPLRRLWCYYQKKVVTKINLLLIRHHPPFIYWILLGIIAILFLRGLSALLPSTVSDAIYKYLVIPKAMAYNGKLSFLPFVPPFYGLLPLQVEAHWAVLFSISNETAVTFWDYLCSVSVLFGIGLFSLKLIERKRAAVYSILLMITTPALVDLMGGGKTDNASIQFGIAAFLCLMVFTSLGWKTAWLAGLCLGWTLASRYTNIIMVPSLFIFLVVSFWKPNPKLPWAYENMKRIVDWFFFSFCLVIFAIVAFVPMLIKNWVLVGCPLAPVWGCENTFWASLYHQAHSSLNNITMFDFVFYPFTWTYASRVHMLGNISPLFLGFFPLLIIYRRSRLVNVSIVAGIAGLAGLISWILIDPFILYTRWLLLPLSLFSIPLGAAFAVAETNIQKRHAQWSDFMMRIALTLIVIFTVFENRSAIYGTAYLVSVYNRDAAYRTFPGYDTALWVNKAYKPGDRIALNLSSSIPPYFFEPEILYSTEDSAELQELWLNPGLNTWDYYVAHGFDYVIVTQEYLNRTNSDLPLQIGDRQLSIVFKGKDQIVVKISAVENSSLEYLLKN